MFTSIRNFFSRRRAEAAKKKQEKWDQVNRVVEDFKVERNLTSTGRFVRGPQTARHVAPSRVVSSGPSSHDDGMDLFNPLNPLSPLSPISPYSVFKSSEDDTVRTSDPVPDYGTSSCTSDWSSSSDYSSSSNDCSSSSFDSSSSIDFGSSSSSGSDW